jgi:hypothetical protein
MTTRLIAFGLLALAAAGVAQQTPAPPPQGVRKDPGFFGGIGQKKGKDKSEDENTRAVAGTVRNEADEPVEGAVVQLKDTKTLKVRSYITQTDGVYKFFGLSTNADYEIRADFKELASEKRTLSVFDSRKQAVLNLKLGPKKKEDAKEQDK